MRGRSVAEPAGRCFGTYAGATELDYDPRTVLSWSGFTAALLPFAAGWLVVPGALLGLAVVAARPRGRAEAGFAALAAVVRRARPARGRNDRRGRGRSRDRALRHLSRPPRGDRVLRLRGARSALAARSTSALALVGSATAWLMPFPATGRDRLHLRHAHVLHVCAARAPGSGTRTRRPSSPRSRSSAGSHWRCFLFAAGSSPAAVGLATIGLLLLSGIPAYAGDHAMTRGTLHLRAGDPPDWLDRSELGPADYLQLPGWLGPLRLAARGVEPGLPPRDPAGSSAATTGTPRRRPGSTGTAGFLVDGHPPDAGILVVNDVCDGDRDRGQPCRRAPSGRAHGLPAAGGSTCSLAGAGPLLRPLGSLGRELSASGRGADRPEGSTGSSLRSLAGSLRGE